MKVRLKTLMAGPDGVFPPGSVIEVSIEESRSLIAGGFAESLVAPSVVAAAEAATVEPGSRAMKPSARVRKTP